MGDIDTIFFQSSLELIATFPVKFSKFRSYPLDGDIHDTHFNPTLWVEKVRLTFE